MRAPDVVPLRPPSRGRGRGATAASVVCAGLLTVLAACAPLAIGLAPEKAPRVSDTALARRAVDTFWDSFQDARYDRIHEVQLQLTAAYLETPRDATLALLLAHTHFKTGAAECATTTRGTILRTCSARS